MNAKSTGIVPCPECGVDYDADLWKDLCPRCVHVATQGVPMKSLEGKSAALEWRRETGTFVPLPPHNDVLE